MYFTIVSEKTIFKNHYTCKSEMENIAIIGTGYVGLVSGAVFSKWGNKVTCVDSNTKKIRELKQGVIPIYEPGLERLIKENKDRILFTTNIKDAMYSDLIFVCVGTPSSERKNPDDPYLQQANLGYVAKVAQEISSIWFW